MTTSEPTVLFLLESSTERARLQGALLGEAAWCGQILAEAEAGCPDVVLLDRQSYATQGQDLQTRWGSTSPDLVLLLDDDSDLRAIEFERTGIADFLDRSQLQGIRLWVTIRNLWQQRQLRQHLRPTGPGDRGQDRAQGYEARPANAR